MTLCVPSFVNGIATFAVHLFPVVSWRTLLLASIRFKNGRRLEITSSRQIWRYLNNICPSLHTLTPISRPECKNAMKDGNSPHSTTVTGRIWLTASERRRDKTHTLHVRTQIFIRKLWALSRKYLSNYLPSTPKCKPRVVQTWNSQPWFKVNSLLRRHVSYIYIYIYI
jgi:hypothetical protein